MAVRLLKHKTYMSSDLASNHGYFFTNFQTIFNQIFRACKTSDGT